MHRESSPYGHTVINARWAVATVFFLNGFVLAVWAARVPEVAARLRIGPGTLSLALLSLAAGALAAFRASAALIDRSGSATATRVFAVIFCAGLAGPAIGRPAAAPRRYRIPTRALTALGVIAFCSAVGEGSMADWSAVYLRDDLAATAAIAALGYAAFSLGMLAGRLAGDRLRARYRPAAIIAISAALAATGLSAGLAVGHAGTVIAGYVTVGAGLALVAPLVFAAVTRQDTQAVSDALASVATMGYAGFLCGPALIGLIARAGNLRSGLYLVAGLCALASIAARRSALLRSG